MKPHIKVIQRNGVDIFVTSSMTMKETASDRRGKAYMQRRGAELVSPTVSDYMFANTQIMQTNNTSYTLASTLRNAENIRNAEARLKQSLGRAAAGSVVGHGYGLSGRGVY